MIVMFPYRKPNTFELRRAGTPDTADGRTALQLSAVSLWWPYGMEGVPYPREYGADWTGEEWVFPDVDVLARFVQALQDNGIRVLPYRLQASAMPLTADESWWQVSLPFAKGTATLPHFAQFAVPAASPRDELIAVLSADELRDLSAAVTVSRRSNPAAKTQLPVIRPEPRGWRLIADVSTHPLSLRIAIATGLLPEAQTPWKTPPLWDGVILSTRAQWPEVVASLRAHGIPAEDAPPLAVSSLASRAAAAPAWHHLYPYQREDVQFLLDHDLRAILGDEMGLGKTAVAISAADAADAQRILVLGPLSSLSVWSQEIRRWSGRGQVQVLRDKATDIAPDTRWLVMTHDTLTIRAESVVVAAAGTPNPHERVQEAFGSPEAGAVVTSMGKRGWTISWDTPLPLVNPEALPDPAVARKIAQANQRLSGAFLAKLTAWQPDLIIVDEAHAVKNWSAKRTQALRYVMGLKDSSSSMGPRVLFLSGTPLRNTFKDAESYIRFLDPEAMAGRTKLTPAEAHDYFQVLMIRHTMDQVHRDMPPWIRQDVPIPVGTTPATHDLWQMYVAALDWARKQRYEALAHGASLAEARQAELPGLTKARHYLGMMKAMSPETLDLIDTILDEKGRVVVFTHHHAVTDELARRLTDAGRSVVGVDGRIADDDERKALFGEFQSGAKDVAVVGIKVAEAISLVRADTVVFLEYDWTPAAMRQAESRIRRIGQTAAGCHVITTIADIGGDWAVPNLDREMLNLLRVKDASIAQVYGTVPEWGEARASVQSALLDRIAEAHSLLDAAAKLPDPFAARQRDAALAR